MLKTDRQRLVLRMGTASFCRRDGEEDMQKRKGTNEVRDGGLLEFVCADHR